MSENVNPETVTDQTPDATGETAVSESDGPGVTDGTAPVDQAAYEALKAAYDVLKRESDGFKRDVVAITGRYAEAHNMCGVVDTALSELGLKRVLTGHRVSVTLTASWDVRTSSRGWSGAPSESTVWGQVESLASVIRIDGIEDVKRRYSTRDNGDFPRLEITTAEVSVAKREPGEFDHLITPVPKVWCSSCEEYVTPDSDGECPSCGEYLTD